MLTYSFANIGSDSLYIHLYKCLKNDILSGVLSPGTKLPSKRSFAKNLGISVITVESAYEQLIAEGYVYSIAKKGFFIADMQEGSKVSQILIEDIRKKPEDSEEKYIADFTSNATLSAHFPFSIWSKLLRDVLNDFQKGIMDNAPSGGTVELRDSISKHLHAFRGMHVNPSQIIIGAGTENLYSQLVQLLGRDKCYGVEDPGYMKISKIYKSNAAKCKFIHFGEDGIDISDLERQKINVAHTSPSHHFPTGVVTPISKRYELLGWASKSDDRYIIEDDYDSEFRLVGKPIPTLQSIDTTEKVIYMNTFSKSLSSTMRISYMVLPKSLVTLYYEKLAFYTCPVTTLTQYSLARFIDRGYFEKHINRMRTFYRKQRDFLVSQIRNSKINEFATISEEDAGLHFILKLNIKCDDDEFIKRMERRRIKISALSEFCHNVEEKSEHCFVMNYSSLTLEQIREAVSEIVQEVSTLLKL
ncbi:MAG: PLP-dependent aminotransferase family protein [Hornefia sp.]|nr:PLP-dependent aminotransferase family protein [Hornefia sp.]